MTRTRSKWSLGTVFAQFLRFVPLILIVLLVFFPVFLSDLYLSSFIRFERSDYFTVQRKSKDDISYFVRQDFVTLADDQRFVNSLEDFILKKKVQKADSECTQQLRIRDKAFDRARKAQASGSDQAQALYDIAFSVKIPSCDELDQMEKKFRR